MCNFKNHAKTFEYLQVREVGEAGLSDRWDTGVWGVGGRGGTGNTAERVAQEARSERQVFLCKHCGRQWGRRRRAENGEEASREADRERRWAWIGGGGLWGIRREVFRRGDFARADDPVVELPDRGRGRWRRRVVRMRHLCVEAGRWIEAGRHRGVVDGLARVEDGLARVEGGGWVFGRAWRPAGAWRKGGEGVSPCQRRWRGWVARRRVERWWEETRAAAVWGLMAQSMVVGRGEGGGRPWRWSWDRWALRLLRGK